MNTWKKKRGKRSIWKNNRGAIYLDVMIGVYCLLFVLAIFLYALPIFTMQNRLNHFVAEVLRTAELSGRIDTEVDGEIARQKRITGLSPELSFSSFGEVDLGEEIVVTGKITVDIGFRPVGSFPVPLVSSMSGRSEVYWKR